MDPNRITTGEVQKCYDLPEMVNEEDGKRCTVSESECATINSTIGVYNNLTNDNLQTNKSKVLHHEIDFLSSFSRYSGAKTRFCDIYRLGNEAVDDEKSEIEKLYAKNDLLGTLREILERNVNIKTEMLKDNLNKILNINKVDKEIDINRKTNEFNREEILSIEEQVDKILLEAQLLVNILLNANFNYSEEARNFCENIPLVSLDNDTVLSKSENMLPLLLEEHILEAPEGFRSNSIQLSCNSPQKGKPNELSDTGILLADELKCHCSAALVEPERPMVTNHGDDNKLTQEVDTSQRAKQEGVEACENDTITTYERENHVNLFVLRDSENACVPIATTTTTITTTIITDSAAYGNCSSELEKVHKEINEYKVDDNGIKFDAIEHASSKLCGDASNSGSSHIKDSNRCSSTSGNEENYANFIKNVNCNETNEILLSISNSTNNNLSVDDISISSKLHLHENKKTKPGSDSRRKNINLTVNDKPKSELNLEHFYLNKKYKFNFDGNNKGKLSSEESSPSSKTKSLSNLIVTDKPRKRISEKVYFATNQIHDKCISSTQYERNEDNDQNGIEARHVGLTTTTPAYLLGDTSRRKVNCCYCVECRNGNESTTTPTSKTIAATMFRNKCNSQEIKVNLKDSREDDRKHDGNEEDNCDISYPSSSTVRDVSCCQCAGSNADTAARNSDMPNSTATTMATSQSSSIETGVERCAELPGCSRESTVSARVALDTSSCTFPTTTKQDSKSTENDRHNGVAVKIESECRKSTEKNCEQNAKAKRVPTEHLTWSFKNGRLVFEDAVLSFQNERESVNTAILTSKELNKKSVEGRQLKLLERKLKEAGITDEIKCTNTQSPNQVIKNDEGKRDEEFEPTEDDEEDLIPEYEHLDFCEFDPSNTNLSSLHLDSDADFYLVYDELLGNEDLIVEMRGEGGMGTNVERKQHNPDHDNLKSLLKKPGHGKDTSRKNRVVFNETKNEFFDADYIILIREECDYDDEDDDGVCTCNQHEMVRLTCCEPNCNCNVYDGYGDPTPQSPKFAPPLEFVDSVTLSPPEEYKDMELEEQQLMALQQIARRSGQRAPVCRECSASHEDEGDGSQSDNEEGVTETISDHDETEEKEKTDQSQQTTPTTPPADSDASINSQRYILETLSMTTVTERQMVKEIEDRKSSPTLNIPPGGSPISGILKGGRLWKQGGEMNNQVKVPDLQQTIESNITSDEESGSRRSVRFIESRALNQRDVCDGAPEKISDEETKFSENQTSKSQQPEQQQSNSNNSASAESTEMMLTFKLGNHVLISNNSLKPNSAVRQLFPCTKPLGTKVGDDDSSSVHQYLVTAESLKAFEEAKRSKLPQIIQSGETDDSIRKAIERNTLRRSLIRYEPRSRKPVQKTDNSLVERIKQLTCNVEEDLNQEADEISQRASPPGEEARNSPEVAVNKNQDKSFSPSSSSTTSSNSSSMSSTCRKFTDLFARRDKMPDIQNVNDSIRSNQTTTAPDLGNGPQELTEPPPSATITKNNPGETKKQFLSTLAPLTACVSGIGPTDDYYHVNSHGGDRTSIASSVGTEYSLEDIDEVLRKDEEETKKIAPDVLAGTPSASESGDELAMFVQQDAGRIERIKKKYQPETTEEDDEHDDYGFNRRPSVRGIKPRFGSTTEILQQIQNQMQPPNNTPPRNHVAWPYYSETNLTGMDNTKSRNINQNLPHYPYPNVSAEDIKRSYASHQYRPSSYIEENIYQNCANQRCPQVNYRTNMNIYPPVVRVGGGCSDYYTSLPRNRNGRPQSPPPQEVSKNYHQTMVYIPYNHIEGYHPMSPNPYYSSTNDPCYARVTNQNQINKRYLDAAYQQRINQPLEDHYPKTILRPSYPSSNHLASSRSESPLPGQFSTARSTQTPIVNMSTCTYLSSRYRPMVGPVNAIPPNGLRWQGEGSKMSRHGFPRYPPSDSISLTDSDSQHSGQMPNGYRQPADTCYSIQKDSIPNSPTKPRFIERGVPEGAASVSPQDSVNTAQNTSTMTSPTSPQNPPLPPTAKPLFYAMNV